MVHAAGAEASTGTMPPAMETLTTTSLCWTHDTDPGERSGLSVNKKGRGETAPTFLIIAFSPVPVHPWSKAFQRCGVASSEFQRSSAKPMRELYL
jgi:hypothetical protein